MRNCDPCSHCLSSSCSRLCGAPLELDDAPLSIEVSEAGPDEVVVEDVEDCLLWKMKRRFKIAQKTK